MICGKLVTKIKVNSKFKTIVARRAVKNLTNRTGHPCLFCLKTIVSLVTKAKRIPRISPIIVASSSFPVNSQQSIRLTTDTTVVATPKKRQDRTSLSKNFLIKVFIKIVYHISRIYAILVGLPNLWRNHLMMLLSCDATLGAQLLSPSILHAVKPLKEKT